MEAKDADLVTSLTLTLVVFECGQAKSWHAICFRLTLTLVVFESNIRPVSGGDAGRLTLTLVVFEFNACQTVAVLEDV